MERFCAGRAPLVLTTDLIINHQIIAMSSYATKDCK